MSVEPIESMNEGWIRWQGYAINGAFPLNRYLGCSDHSGVFLTEFPARQLSEVAIKVMPVDPTLAESQLLRLRTAAGLAHRHLIRLIEIGRCYLEGSPCLYAVMEYADQTLAQLLAHRALTEEEAREMLLPTLDALLFLHNRNLVQGQLKPANLLAVGNQLKLASDTILRVGEGIVGDTMASMYDPPEARYGTRSTAGDIWGLGATLVEALTRSPLWGLDEHEGEVALPPDFPPAFREIVARCLSVKPGDRPNVKELVAWLRAQSGGSPPAAPVQPAAPAQPAATVQAVAPVKPAVIVPPAAPVQPLEGVQLPKSVRPAERMQPAEHMQRADVAGPKPSPPEAPRPWAAIQELVRDALARAAPVLQNLLQYSKRRSILPVALGAVAVLGLSWIGVRALTTHRNPTPAPVETPRDPGPEAGSAAVPAAMPVVPAPLASAANSSSGAIARSGHRGAATAPPAIHEEIPDVPLRARRTIRGHIKVYVRVMVDKDGTVFAALPDRSGPSRYFERLAVQAAKKWSFPPADTPDQRLMQVRFDFSRGGTTARAVALH